MRNVEYYVGLIDRFSSVAAKISEAAKNAAKGVNVFGGAANNAEKAIGGLATKSNTLAGSFQKSSAAIERQRIELNMLSKQADMTQRAMNRMQANRDARAALGPDPNNKRGGMSVGGAAASAFGAYYLGKAAFGSVDHLLARAGNVDALRNRMLMATGGDSDAVQNAYDKAFELSGKFKNTTVAENLQIIDDLRANLPERMQHIIGESTEPFVRLHSFFKALEGGKHTGKSTDALKDISLAIRSGELIGQMTGKQLADHAQAIATARIQFGDKFQVSEYFKATQKAMVPLTAADETFKHVDFPMMVQRLGINAGVAVNSLNQKLIGGIRLKGAADIWARAGLMDPEFMKNEGTPGHVAYNKSGGIDSKSLIGQRWIAGSDELAKNALDWAVKYQVPALERLGVRGIDAAGIQGAWKSGNFEKLTEFINAINRPDLTRNLSGLGYDQNTVRALEAFIVDLPSALRDRIGTANALKNVEQYKSYDKAKQEMGGQLDKLWQSLAGNELIPFVVEKFDGVSSAIGDWAKSIKDDPGLRGDLIAAGQGIGAILAGALAWKAVRFMGKGGLVGAGAFGLYELYQQWDTIKDLFNHPIKLNLLWGDGPPEWFKKVAETLQWMRNNSNKALFNSPAYAEDYLKGHYGSKGAFGIFGKGGKTWDEELKDEMTREANRARHMSNPAGFTPNPSVGRFANPNFAAQAAQRVEVTSQVNVTAPQSIGVNVTVSGQVNGPLTGNGRGDIPIGATADRGRALAGSAAP